MSNTPRGQRDVLIPTQAYYRRRQPRMYGSDCVHASLQRSKGNAGALSALDEGVRKQRLLGGTPSPSRCPYRRITKPTQQQPLTGQTSHSQHPLAGPTPEQTLALTAPAPTRALPTHSGRLGATASRSTALRRRMKLEQHLRDNCGLVRRQAEDAGGGWGHLKGPLQQLQEERLGLRVGDGAPRGERLVRSVEQAVEEIVVTAVNRDDVVCQRREHLDDAAGRHRRVPARASRTHTPAAASHHGSDLL